MNILVLSDQICEELVNYFKSRKFNLLSSDEVSDYQVLDYILVDSEFEVKTISESYNADQNNIQILCLGEVKDYRTFLTFNGRFNIDENYLKTPLGEIILDKYFSTEYSLHLNENFNSLFNSVSSFKVTNHLSSGLYLDELSANSFEAGFNLVSIRSYMDHILAYFTYLKQASLAGVPFEVEYSHNEDFFVVNTYLTVRNFVAEYMIDSFGSVNSKSPLQYLLGVANRSTDFLEITYFENPGRLALTAVWSKEANQFINSVAFNNVLTQSQAFKKVERKVKKYKNIEKSLEQLDEKQEKLKEELLPGGILELIQNNSESEIFNESPEEMTELIAVIISETAEKNISLDDLDEEIIDDGLNILGNEEFASKITAESKKEIIEKIKNKNIQKAIESEFERVRGSLSEDEDFKATIQDTLTENISEKVSSELSVEDINTILNSTSEEDEDPILIKGKKEAQELVQIIKGQKDEKDNFKQVISNSFSDADDKFKQIISGSTDPLEKKGLFRNLIDSKVRDINDELSKSLPLNTQKYVAAILPREIELGLEEYAKNMNKTFESLSELEIEEFHQKKLPQIINSLVDDESLVDEFAETIIEEAIEQVDPETKIFKAGLKEKLELELEKIGNIEKVDGNFKLTEDIVAQEDFQQLLKDSVQETLESNFSLENASKEEIKEKEELIVKNIASTVKDKDIEVRQIIKDASDQVREIEKEATLKKLTENSINPSSENTQSNIVESELIKKVNASELENKKLKNQLSLLEGKLKSKDASLRRFEKIKEKEAHASSAVVKRDIEKSPIDSELKPILEQNTSEGLISDLKKNQGIESESIAQVESLLKSEKNLINKAKNLELELKKAKHDLAHKDSLFKSEISKIERTSKGKEIVLEKTKASFTGLLKQKELDNRELTNQIDILNKKISGNQTAKLQTKVLELKKDNELLAKSAEMFKSRIESMSKMKSNQDKKTDTETMIDDNRNLKLETSQLRNQLSSAQKEFKTWETRLNKSKEAELRLKNEIQSLKRTISKSEEMISEVKVSEAKKYADLSSAQRKQTDLSSSKEVMNLKSQNLQLQKKLKEIAEKSKASASVNSSSSKGQSPKEKLLEKDKKRLQADMSKVKQDLDESKKVLMKFKGENTKLKNETEKQKKDIERLARQLKSLKAGDGKKAA